MIIMERLADKKPPIKDKGKFLQDMAMGFEKGLIFRTALEFDVFTKLKEPKTVETLSTEMETHPEITSRFLDVLVALCLLSKHEDRYVTALDIAPFLVEGEHIILVAPIEQEAGILIPPIDGLETEDFNIVDI